MTLMNVNVAEGAMSSLEYRELFEGIVARGEQYGPPGGGYGADYTKLNLARTRRIEKTLKVLPAVQALMERAEAQTWLVITEPWCGDSAQNLPVLLTLASMAPSIKVRILQRDTNLEVMDRYLTNGARSIPKLIAFDRTGNELFQWGPRPVAAHDLIMGNKIKPEGERLEKDALAEALHRWYHENGGHDVQMEIAESMGAVGRSEGS